MGPVVSPSPEPVRTASVAWGTGSRDRHSLGLCWNVPGFISSSAFRWEVCCRPAPPGAFPVLALQQLGNVSEQDHHLAATQASWGTHALHLPLLLELTSYRVEATNSTAGTVVLVEKRRPRYTHEAKRCKHITTPMPPPPPKKEKQSLVLLSSSWLSSSLWP